MILLKFLSSVRIANQKFFGLMFGMILLIGCDPSTKENNIGNNLNDVVLFEKLPPSKSGIDFVNYIPENTYMNGLFYEYYYNGSGVATGDFNNDGFDDIYFVSTLDENKLYLNNKDQSFKDITPYSKTKGKASFQTGVTTVDINNDGLLDIYVCASGRIENVDRRRNELYINQGVDKNGYPYFKEDAKSYRLDLPHFSTQASFFDYDKDGDLDVFVINHGIDPQGKSEVANYALIKGALTGEKLFRNDNGKYTDVTLDMGIIDNKLSFGLGITIGDLNNDSWPDIYVSHDFYGKDHCYLNQNGKKFSEVTNEAMKHIPNFSMGNDMGDFNNDGWMDIVSVDMMSEDNYSVKTSMSSMDLETFHEMTKLDQHYQYMFNTIQLNNGSNLSGVPVFSDIAQLTGASSTDWSWGPLFMDMDNDGNLDLFVSNGIKRDFRNNDFVNFTKNLREKIGDNGILDQQGYVKKVMSKIPTRYKPNYFFRNLGNLTFEKMNGKWDNENPTCSNGAAYADFDNDGDLDLVLNNTDSLSYVQWNNAGNLYRNNYLKIKFDGSKKNKLGIGARVIIGYDSKKQLREHYLSRGFQSSVAPGIHFGLKKNENIDILTVIWPDNKKQILKNTKPNQTLTLSHEDAKLVHDVIQERTYNMFDDVTDKAVAYKHRENPYDDFKKETLLPHKMSQQGPAFAIGDINSDGIDDFYLGGALGYPGNLFVQNYDGTFSIKEQTSFQKDRLFEDVGAALFDADNDGDLDLYVVSGSNEQKEGTKYYQDRFYENIEGIFTKKPASIPRFFTSGSCVKPYDYDKDGDMDLFVGGRQTPGRYPYPTSSHLLENRTVNGSISFIDVSREIIPALEDYGMVTDAVWTDIDSDGLADLVIVGEWMPIKIFINKEGHFIDYSKKYGVDEEVGWWNCISAADYDNDGDIDFICGNLGLNYKYKASKEETFDIYTKDFDESGNLDIVLGYYSGGDLYPLRGRECSSNQMPFIKKKFESYDAFGKATLEQVYGKESLNSSIHYKANNFSSMYFENKGEKLVGKPLGMLAQVSSIVPYITRQTIFPVCILKIRVKN